MPYLWCGGEVQCTAAYRGSRRRLILLNDPLRGVRPLAAFVYHHCGRRQVIGVDLLLNRLRPLRCEVNRERVLQHRLLRDEPPVAEVARGRAAVEDGSYVLRGT